MTDATRPPRGYSWPPLAPGHTLSTVHGARSQRHLEPAAQTALERLKADLPAYLDDPSYAGALWDLARAEAVCDLLTGWLAMQGEADPTAKKVHGALEMLRRYLTLVANMRTRLGLDPTGRARLQRDLGTGEKFDLAKFWAEEDDEPTPGEVPGDTEEEA